MSKKLCITFDLDDTLIPTQEELYDKSRKYMSGKIASLLNTTDEKVQSMFSLYDRANIPFYGFSKKRYPTSWVETFNHFAGDSYANLEEQKSSIYSLANWIFETKIQPYPSVLSLLSELKKDCDMLNILTAGDPEIQEMRVDDANLRSYFDSVVVVPLKNPETMKKYLSDKEGYQHVMIGNSLRSDIYPALECGMIAIHIESGGWFYDHYEVDKNHANYYVTTLEGVPSIIEQIKKMR